MFRYGTEVSSIPEDSRIRKLTHLNILSPISDKSGEQVSPSSDSVAPNLSAQPRQEGGGSASKKRNLNLNLDSSAAHPSWESACALKSLRTPDIQQYLNVPWDMPKLKKKLQNRRSFCFSGQISSPENSPKKTTNLLPKSPDVELLSNSSLDNANNNNNKEEEGLYILLEY